MEIIVIGAGLGGLGAAVRLQAQGHRVTLCEAGDQPGGRARVFRQDGFTFDAGPTIITVPQLIAEPFRATGRNPDDYYRLRRLAPFYNVRFPDGSRLTYDDDGDRLRAQIRRFNPADGPGYERFEQAARRVFEQGFPLMTRPFPHLGSMLRLAPQMLQLQVWQSVAGFTRRYLRDPRLQQAFSFHPLLIGGNPETSTAIYAMIHRLEQEFGIWFPEGGTGALVQAYVRLFRELGGDLRLSTPVAEIRVQGDRTCGVTLGSGESLEADAVVSNADVGTTLHRLLPPGSPGHWREADRRRRRWSMSLAVLYFGTDRRYEDLAHHEILMGDRYDDWLRDVFERGRLSRDFPLYLHRPTATDPGLAPPGCDTFYALVPVPNLESDIDWDQAAPLLRERLLDHLEATLLPGLRSHLVTQRWVDPRYFRDELHSYRGAAFSLQPTLFQSAAFRPSSRHPRLSNLYLVGAGTHPGAGIPGVLSSARICADLIGTAS